MATKIDGTYSLEELESAILNKEAAANELTALDNNHNADKPLTLATFKKLGPGKRPKPLHLVEINAAPPSGTTPVCSGIVFINGETAEIAAFRNK
jgi:hypothetical protein